VDPAVAELDDAQDSCHIHSGSLLAVFGDPGGLVYGTVSSAILSAE
jgi:hypothetical protein